MPSPLDIALGKIGKNGNPIHPALVHYPLTFLLTASLLDIGSFFSRPNYDHAAILTKILSPDHIPVLNSMSYFCTVAALLTSIPTLITGGVEGYHLFFGGNLDPRDVKPGNLHPMVKMTLIHAWLNYASVAGAVYNWRTRRNVEGYSASGSNAIASGFIIGAMGYAAFLGGTLVYTRGLGCRGWERDWN
ncbi:hypothetical protein B0J14DRAFT_159626 [Halenospora varia]|nr:hypothetical protein B0J14DRAFT_159626 [Halenospora varia]